MENGAAKSHFIVVRASCLHKIWLQAGRLHYKIWIITVLLSLVAASPWKTNSKIGRRRLVRSSRRPGEEIEKRGRVHIPWIFLDIAGETLVMKAEIVGIEPQGLKRGEWRAGLVR